MLYDVDTIILLLMLGAVMGCSSGLLGLGGAILVNPVLWFVFDKLGYNDYVFLTSGTMSLTIFINASVATRRHHCAENIAWDWAPYLICGGLLGAMLGPEVASRVPLEYFKIGFSVLQLYAAAYLIWKSKNIEDKPIVDMNRVGLFGLGVFSGLVAGTFGVGGGIVTVPLLLLVCHLPVRKAVGTSALIMVFTLSMSTIKYVQLGWVVEGLPAPHLGYVFLPAVVLLALTGMLFAWLSAAWVHKINQAVLQKCLAVALFLSGCKIIVTYFFPTFYS